MEQLSRQESIELMERADLIMLNGDSEEALRLLQRAVDIDPLNAEARRMLEGIKARMHRPAAAVVAGAHDTEDIEDLLDQARRAESAGQYDLAESLCRRVLAIEPDNAKGRAELMAIGIKENHQGGDFIDNPLTPTGSSRYPIVSPDYVSRSRVYDRTAYAAPFMIAAVVLGVAASGHAGGLFEFLCSLHGVFGLIVIATFVGVGGVMYSLLKPR